MVAPSGDIIMISKVREGKTPKMYTITADTIKQGQIANLTDGNLFVSFHNDNFV